MARKRRNNRRTRGKRRTGARKFTTQIRTVVAPGNRYRTILSDNVSSNENIGTVSQLQIMLKPSRYPNLFNKVSQLKINKIGITILPMTYLEFLVRGINSPNLDNRAELINQSDCIKVYAPNKPKTYWFRPNQANTKDWIDVQSSATYTTGLWIIYTGQNQLNMTGSEILFQLQLDVSFNGVDFLT